MSKDRHHSVGDLVARLSVPPRPGVFRADDCVGLPPGAVRYLRASIAPGTRHARAARLAMRGSIRLGSRWLPFRATEVVAPHEGFVWAARVAGLVAGTDSFVDGAGNTAFSLAGVIPLAQEAGPDVDRSAAGRAGAEAVWVPTALLPGAGVAWDEAESGELRAQFEVAGEPVELALRVLPSGHLSSVSLARWGDPQRTGEHGWHRFGLDVTGYGQAYGITFPAAGRVGWLTRAADLRGGEFFRFRVTSYAPIGE